MKKDLYEILDTLTPEELDTLPEELFQAETLDDATLKSIQTAVAEKTGVTLGTKEYTENNNASTETGITAPVRKTAAGLRSPSGASLPLPPVPHC